MYLYALCLDIDPVQLPQGIKAPLQVITHDGITAVIEPTIDLVSLQQDDAQLISAVVRHDQIICDLFAQTTVLPLRFGTQFSSETALRSQLHTQATDTLAQLRDLDGKAEICLTLTPKDPELPDLDPGLKGRDYFRAKKERLQIQNNAQVIQQSQLSQLQEILAQTFTQSNFQDTPQIRAYLLIKQTQIPNLPKLLATLHGQFSHWQITASEALPPYHFVN